MLLALLADGVDIIWAFTAVGTCPNGLGPGLAGVGLPGKGMGHRPSKAALINLRN